ncbi:hypothetical protein CYY_009685, partial [Polysphondylium violaceum]
MKDWILIVLAILCTGVSISGANDIRMKDVTLAPGKYARMSGGTWRCNLEWRLQFTQDTPSGVITITGDSPVFTTKRLEISTPLEFIYLLGLTVNSGPGSVSFEATNGVDAPVPLLVNYNCQIPPGTINVEMYGDTLIDGFDTSAEAPMLAFKVTNLELEASISVTTTSKSIVVSTTCAYLQKSIYFIPFQYASANLWQDLFDDFNITLYYFATNTPLYTTTVRNNLIKSNVNIIDPKIYGLDSSNNIVGDGFYVRINVTSSVDTPTLSITTYGSSIQRNLYSIGNATNGVIYLQNKASLKIVAPEEFQSNFASSSGIMTYNYSITTPTAAVPNIVVSKTDISFLKDILHSSIETNQAITLYIFNVQMGAEVLASSLPYPYGYSLGNSKLFTRSDDYFLSNGAYGKFNFRYYNNDAYSYSQDLGRTGPYDNEPPVLHSIERFQFGTITVFRVHITDATGFNYISTIGNYTSLINGTIQDGFYEFQVDQKVYYNILSYVNICDQALNCAEIKVGVLSSTIYKILDTNEFNSLAEISSIYFKHDQVDASYQGIDNAVYLCSNISTLNPHIYFLKGTDLDMELIKPILGIYNNDIGCYEFEFRVDKNAMQSSYAFHYRVSSSWVPFSSLTSIYGERSRLKIKSINGDALGPMVTKVELLPRHIVNSVGEDMYITWRFTIQDSTNGFKTGHVSIVGDLGLVRYNYTLSPTSDGYLVSGNQYSGEYEIKVQIKSKCASQLFYIHYMVLSDEYEYTTYYSRDEFSSSKKSPLMQFSSDIDGLTSIDVVCQTITDTDPPFLIDFNFFPKIIDSTYNGELTDRESRLVLFSFTVNDDIGLLNTSLPIIYIHDQNYQVIQKTASLFSFGGTSAIYNCPFYLPFGFGFPGGLKVSVFGMVDLNSNMRGYSMSELDTANFPNTIQVQPTLNSNPAIFGTSQLTSDGGLLYVMGKNILSTDELIVQDATTKTLQTIFPDSNLNSIAQFNTIVKLPNYDYVYITFKRTASDFSNTYTVNITKVETLDSSSSDGSLEPSEESSSDHLPTNPPQECLNRCGNGKCTPNGCVCNPSWVGLDCSSQVIIVNPTINTTLPSTNITIPSTDYKNEDVLYAIISVVAVNELDKDGNIVY